MVEMVSVVIPCYNSNRNKLERTIQSVLDQSWTNIEVIVVDDGSLVPFSEVDKTPSLEDDRLHWFSIGENRGVASARNAAVKRATGDYLAFLDTGDWWERTKLEEQIEAVREASNIGLVYPSAVLHYPDCSKRVLHAKVYEDVYRELLVWQPITGSASSVLMPRSVFDDLNGFFDAEDIPEDRDLWLRIAKKYKIISVLKNLVNIEVLKDSRSANPESKKITYRRFLRLHEESIKEAGLWRTAVSRYHVGIARKYFFSKKFVSGSAQICFALVAEPKLIAYFIKKLFKK